MFHSITDIEDELMAEKFSGEIVKLAAMENQNVEKNVKRLSTELQTLDALVHTFASLQPLVQKVLLEEDDIMRYVAIINLYQLIGQDILKGAVNFNKGYVTDASFQTRRILESIALAIKMYQKPSKVKYYTTFDTEADREKYIEEFKIFIVIKKTLSPETQNDYKRLCFAVHPSALSIGDRAKIDENFQHSIELIEYPRVEDTPRFRMHFLVLVGTIYHAIRDLAVALKDDPKFDWKKSELLLQKFENSWNENRQLLFSEHPELLDIQQDKDDLGEQNAKTKP